MHQTFYIDIDEEITSIVERLRAAKTNEIILVVPKRALLVQSIVNLKILKKEADESGLQLMIITQDKLGKMLIEKAGILVQQKMDNIAEGEINPGENEEVDGKYYGAKKEINETAEVKNRLDKIGSEDFFHKNNAEEENINKTNEIKQMNQNKEGNANDEILINKELVAGMDKSKKNNFEKIKNDMDVKIKKEDSTVVSVRPSGEDFARQDKKIESFFYQNNNRGSSSVPEQKKYHDESKDYNISSGTHKWFWVFGIVCVLAIASILSYLFLPKANVIIVSKAKAKSIDLDIAGDANSSAVDYSKEIIPIKIIAADQEISENFNSSGSQSASGKKARGKVTIYNEYNASPQPLVATTRLLSESGKLFRLSAAVTVPGTTKDGDTVHPGVIEAEVVADEAGEDFNIGAEKFTIPGFKDSGNEKYSKFYAKSTEAMSGGGSSGETVHSITDEDIAAAKSKMASELDGAIEQKIKESAGEGMIVLDGTINKEEAAYKLSNSSGEAVDSFKVTVQIKASAAAAAEKDLKDLAARALAKAGEGKINMDSNSIALDFGKSSVDPETGLVDIKFHASGKINPDFNPEDIKKEILGKNEEDLKAYLSQFSNIESASVEYWPTFISGRIPFQEKRVKVTLDNN